VTEEAQIDQTEEGAVVASRGWYVLNLGEVAWKKHDVAGRWTVLEPEEARFEHYGINVHVLEPGEPNARYHSETSQEDFLVLSGECLLLVEGEERRLKAWDFFHCAPGTHHIFVGAGAGPCAILMVGARIEGEELHYPRSEQAARYGASAPTDTTDPREAYSDWGPNFERVRQAWPL
jgi:uncharacterized cupin superfamily protein